MHRNPLNQGDLDRLCGIYAVINATNYLCNMNEDEREILWKLIIEKLDKTKKLKDALVTGTYIRQLSGMLEEIKYFVEEKYNKKLIVEQLGDNKNRNNISGCWNNIREFLEIGDGSRRIVIILLNGKHEHWTCVTKVSDKSLTILDSLGLFRINRNNCTTGKTMDKLHILVPNKMWGLII